MSAQFNLYAHAMGANPTVARTAAQQLRDTLNIPMHSNDVDRLRANGIKVVSNASQNDIKQAAQQIESIGLDLRIVDAHDRSVIGTLWHFAGNGPAFADQLSGIDFSGRTRSRTSLPDLPIPGRMPKPSGPETVALSLSSSDDATPTGFTSTHQALAEIDLFDRPNFNGSKPSAFPKTTDDSISLRLGPDLNEAAAQAPGSGLSINSSSADVVLNTPITPQQPAATTGGPLSLDLPPRAVSMPKAAKPAPSLANNTFKPAQKSRRGRVSLTQQTRMTQGKVTVERGPMIPFVLALALGAVAPWFYSEMEMANSIHLLREDLATARKYGDLTDVGKVYRTRDDISNQLQTVIYRSMAKTGLIWLGGFLLLFVIFRALLT